MTSIDRKTTMSSIEQSGPSRSAQSPFFIAAVGMTIALVVVAAVVAFLS